MDKWKDIELEKMKAGGNRKFREFLESQDDYDPCWSMQEKYNSKAAALFRDQVSSIVCVFSLPENIKILCEHLFLKLWGKAATFWTSAMVLEKLAGLWTNTSVIVMALSFCGGLESPKMKWQTAWT